MNFDRQTKVKDIAVSNSEARQILEDAGVDFCCGGDRSLQDACLHVNVPAEEILSRLRENSKLARGDEASWTSLSELTRHIREKHHRYVREAIPRVQALLEKVRTKHGTNHPEIQDIERAFLRVSREMIAHMQKEEQVLFPYIETLERSVKENGILEPPFFGTVRNPIHTMMKEHDSAGDLVEQIRRASAEYTVPADACPSYQRLLGDLRQFEADLHQHVHLENNILFPRAVEMEASTA